MAQLALIKEQHCRVAHLQTVEIPVVAAAVVVAIGAVVLDLMVIVQQVIQAAAVDRGIIIHHS